MLGSTKCVASLIKSLLIVTVTVAVVSAPIIPERCIHCGQRVSKGGNKLRMLSPVEWLYDTTSDLHFECVAEWKWNKIVDQIKKETNNE